MPELPEVETVVRTLETQIKDQQIVGVEVYYPKIIQENQEFCRTLLKEHFCTFSRRGKYLVFGMDHCQLVVHLRMEGKFYIEEAKAPLNKHIHVCFKLENGKELRYRDTRKFGRMEILSFQEEVGNIHGLGPEPFSSEFKGEYVYRWTRKKNLPLKSLLLDQRFVAGIGNIYADEILARLKLRPRFSAHRLTKKQCQDLVLLSREVLGRAIELGGSTIRSYTSSLGVTGRFQLECLVHGRKVCPSCQSFIKIIRVGGRSSYYCPHCQKS